MAYLIAFLNETLNQDMCREIIGLLGGLNKQEHKLRFESVLAEITNLRADSERNYTIRVHASKYYIFTKYMKPEKCCINLISDKLEDIEKITEKMTIAAMWKAYFRTDTRLGNPLQADPMPMWIPIVMRCTHHITKSKHWKVTDSYESELDAHFARLAN